MVGMFVGDEDGVDAREVFANGRQALAKLPHAEARVHQDARVFGGQQCGVSGTAACQNAKLNDVRPPESLGYTKILQNRIGEECLVAQIFALVQNGPFACATGAFSVVRDLGSRKGTIKHETHRQECPCHKGNSVPQGILQREVKYSGFNRYRTAWKVLDEAS
jgi:hypothetical protein